jgi:uncharacterized protein YutE (UPF0331/DUF86 family)
MKLNPLNIINDVFEIEEISKVNHMAALDPARTILNKIVADICERNGITESNNLFDNLKSLEANGILSEKALLCYHFIRKLRNIAVYAKLDNKTDINLDDIQMVRFMLSNIIKWYLESVY